MNTGLSAVPLGPVLAEHGLRSGLRLRQAGMAVLGAVASLFCLGYGLYRGYFAFSHFGPAVVWRWSAPALLSALVFALLAGVGLVMLVGARRILVTVHESGLSVERGQTRWVIPWVRIRRIHTTAYRDTLPWPSRRSMAELILFVEHLTPDGTVADERIRLDRRVESLESLADAVKVRVYPALLEEYTQAFNEGQQVPFGPITLAAEGLRWNGRIVPWTQVGPAELRRGRLIVQPAPDGAGRQLRLPARKVPNVEILLQILEQVGQSR